MRNIKLLLCIYILLSTGVVAAQVARALKADEEVQKQTVDNDALLKKYYELTTIPILFKQQGATIYKGKHLEAIQFPVGGIGTGSIQYDGNAVPRFWQIFNNMTHDFIPNSFFAIRVKSDKGTEVRALQTKEVGLFKGMKSLEAVSKFPYLKYRFNDAIDVNVCMEVSNPFVPTNMKESGIPVVFYQFTIENSTNKNLEISLLASQQNAVGFSKIPIVNGEKSFADNYALSINRKPVRGNKSSLYGGNKNTIAKEKNAIVLYMESNLNKSNEHFGQMALMVLGDSLELEKTEGIASWNNEQKLYNRFKSQGEIKGKATSRNSKKGTTWTGALNVPFVLKAGENKIITMALVWYFPNGKNGGKMEKWDAWGKGDWEGDGNYYANRWGDIKELTSYLQENYNAINNHSRTFTNTFYETNLPYWLTERIANQLSILNSRTIFHDKNGYVGLWEGVGGSDGSCAGNCNHVWHYAQSHARLFPSLGKSIKEQSFKAIKENGQIPYRLPAGTPAFDGQCGDILGAYREHLLSKDNKWLKSQYSSIKRAMNYLVNKHDEDKDGWLSEKAKHTTYDASMTGNPSFLSSLYLAALKASEKMAIASNDLSQAEEWKMISEKSAIKQSDSLWNGEYFQQIKGEKPRTDYDDGCHSDQLLGQWWADQLGLGSMYPDYKIKSATEAILKYNFKSDLRNHNQGHRTFALPEEAGMIVTTWPKKERPIYASGYSSEVWTTFEYTVGASLFKYNKIQDALTILKSGYDRYNGELRTGYTGDWGNFGFSGNPFGDDECGQFYGRALSIWSVLLAAQGFDYNGPEKSMGFNPTWKPENHQSFFSAAEGWGSFVQKRTNVTQENTITLKYGRLSLAQVSLKLGGISVNNITVLLNGEPLKCETKIDDSGNLRLNFEEITLKENDILTVNTNL